jgi:dihydroneopterin aldolase
VYRVFLNELEFYAYHGVPAEERAVGHRYRATISLLVDGNAHVTDEVKDTVDYGEVAKVVEQVSGRSKLNTVERLAQVIAEALLEKFELAHQVNIYLEKRLPPAPVIAESAGVELELIRP